MYVHRELEKEIKPFLKRKEVLAIVGARQVGKTTFLSHLAEEIEQTGKKVKFITFEKKSDRELFNTVEDFKEVYQQYPVVIIDEFQYAKDGGQKLKYLFDTTKTKYIISGSSSLDLKFQTGKYMVGRMVQFTLWPFSFREHLSYADPELFKLINSRIPNLFSFLPKNSFGPTINQRLEKIFEEYLVFGGYPAPALAKDRKTKEKLLGGILENYLLKDIREVLHLATEHELVQLIKLLAVQAGNLVSYRELSDSSGMHHREVLRHLEILRQTYIIDLIKPYFTNKRTELTKNPKVYFIDPGLRNSVLADFKPVSQRGDAGSLAENYVFTALRRRSSSFQRVNFWRTKSKAEVDFVLPFKNKVIPIEAKYSSSPIIGKSLHGFMEKFSPAQVIILTRGYAAEKKIKNSRVKFLPIYYL